MTTTRNKLAQLVAATLVSAASVTVNADLTGSVNPLSTGYEGLVIAEKSSTEGRCGEGKCGNSTSAKSEDGKCGEGKCGEASTASSKDEEGKCGEGKCGAA